MRRIVISFCVTLLVLAGASTVTAQEDTVCQTIVERALTATDKACDGIGRNEVCYGNVEISAELNDPELTFEGRGDVVSISTIDRIELAGLDEENALWGVLLARVQANIPGTLPGQAVTLLMFGETALSQPDETMSAFTFQSGVGTATCENAPDGMLVQTPDGVATVTLTINGVDIALGSTALITAQPASVMNVTLLEGQADVTAQGVTETVMANEFVEIPVDANLAPSAPPTAAQPIPQSAQATNAALPVAMLPSNPFGVLPADGVWSYLVTGQTEDCGGQMSQIMGASAELGTIEFTVSDDRSTLTATFNGTDTAYTNIGDNTYFDEVNDVIFVITDENTMTVSGAVPAIPGCRTEFVYTRAP